MSWGSVNLFNRDCNEKSLDQKESVSQHMVERRQCGGGLGARAGNGSGKARNRRFLDRCASAAESKKEKGAALIRAVDGLADYVHR